MWVIRAFLDRLVLLFGVVTAGCIPSFIVQYRQRLDGRLEQVLMDLSPFQAIADREHNGSLAQLIQYHLQSNDATFHQEGAAIQAMQQSADQLRAMVQALNTDLAHQFSYLLGHSDPALLRTTWEAYHPSFTLDLQGVLFALLVGVAIWGLFLLVWFALAWLLGSIAGVEPGRRHSGLR